MSIAAERIIRSSRKTIGLEMRHDGSLWVRAPRRASSSAIQRVLEENHHWITVKRQQVLAEVQLNPPKNFTDGEEFLFMGERYPLVFIDEAFSRLKFDRQTGFMIPEAKRDKAAELLEKWYRKQARQIIVECVEYFAEEFNLEYHGLSITGAQKRWGSCSMKKTLNFSWRLIMAPLNVVDYVVVHELAHLKQMNHSKLFWLEVEKMLPDYRERRRWLRKNQGLLSTF
jgi:predicted metal-dependent hydrolase